MNKCYHFVIHKKGYGKKIYRTLKHNIGYKENYFRNGLIILSVLTLLDLIILYLIW